jgi:signal transduction histidine kinase
MIPASRFSLRTKLTAIPILVGLGFGVLILGDRTFATRVRESLHLVEDDYIPLIESGPRLKASFTRLKQSLQDAVSANDSDLLDEARTEHAELQTELDGVAAFTKPQELAQVKRAIEEYYTTADAVSRRLMAHETGTGLVEAMTRMQEQREQALTLLAKATSFGREKLHEAFETVDKTRRDATNGVLAVGAVLTFFVLAFVLKITRGILFSLSSLAAAFSRFGSGDFVHPIRAEGHDELSQLARLANRMAERIQELMGELTKKSESLELVNRELESFSYSVAHDLRAPLRAMSGFSQNLLENDFPPDEVHRQLERIAAASRKMGLLVDGLLGLSQINRKEVVKTETDLSAIAREVLGSLREGAPDRVVATTIEPDCRANADPRLLHAVLTNLLGNAWKFTAKRPDTRIEFGKRNDGSGDVFFVRDNGAGFDMQYADKLFGTFQRLHSEKEFAGTGIGLATVQRVIQRHGGKIWAEAAVGAGATFFFTLG